MSVYNKIQSFVGNWAYSKGTTLVRQYSISDNSGTPQDPDSFSAQLTAPDGSKQAVALTKVAVGQYALSWKIPTTALSGTWTLIVTAISGLQSQTETLTFIVS